MPGWRAERWLALVLAGLVLAAQLSSNFATRLDHWLFDHGSQRVLQQPSDRVAIVLAAPDLARTRHAQLIDLLVGAEAKVIVDLLPLSSSQAPLAQTNLLRMRQIAQTALPADSAAQHELLQGLDQLEAQDGDRLLAASLSQAHNVVLAAPCAAPPATEGTESPLPPFVLRSSLKPQGGYGLPARCTDWPQPMFGEAAWGVGQLSHWPDADGVLRREALLLSDQERALPSVTLLAVLRSLDLDLDDLHTEPGHAVQLGPLRLPTDAHALLWPRQARTRDGQPVFAPLRAADLLAVSNGTAANKLPLAGRIVLLAPSDAAAQAEALAQTVSSMLEARVLQSAAWTPWVGAAAFVAALVLLVLGAGVALLPAALSLGAGVLLLLGAEFALLLAGTPLPLAMSASLLALALVALLLRRVGQPLTMPASNAPLHAAQRRAAAVATPAKPAAPSSLPAPVQVPPPAAMTPAAPPLPQLLGERYRLERELARGSMGVVYLAHDNQTGKHVAIKTLSLSQEFDGAALDDARARFFREAETAARLQHPNIVQIYDSGEVGELAYIAMEYVEGQTLQAWCQQGHLLPQDQVLAIVAQVASALAYAHMHNVVHRDVKPANMLYNPASGTVKVSDFGVARILDQSRTRTGLVLGTPNYMSPEQVAGRRIDGQSDIYSLGVMLYQMLTGVLPFYGQSLAELMHHIATDEAPDIRRVRPELPAELAAIVARMLHKQPLQRYDNGEQLAAELRALLPPVHVAEKVANFPATVRESGRSDAALDPAWAATLTLPKKH